jgi:hypothetical protein
MSPESLLLSFAHLFWSLKHLDSRDGIYFIPERDTASPAPTNHLSFEREKGELLFLG